MNSSASLRTGYAEVIGDPIGHSKSPIIHGFWLEALGMAGEYRATHVTPEALGDYFAARAADPDWLGCNITIPHKESALAFVEDRGGVKTSIGAINLAFRSDGAVVGTNTDAAGFYAPISGLDLAGQPVVVVGAGGAARAILFALSRVGVGPVTVLNRNPLKGAALLASFGLKGDALKLDAPLPPAALLVNATSLGMAGQPPLELDLSPLPEDAVVYDIVYAPLETALLKAARARDLDTVDGLEMLIGQAALAFELLFGSAPPRDRDDDLRALLTA
jgi:shikimate dehydrogenase